MILDWIAPVATGGFACLVYAIGTIMGRRVARKTIDVPDPHRPVCDCTHPLAYHDPSTGACNGRKYYHSTGAQNSQWKPCPCLQYVGPKPAEEFFTSDIAWNSTRMIATPKEDE